MHDASYLQTLELKGSFAPLKDLLCMICDPAAVPPYSKRYISGVRECPIDLYEFEAYPRSLIGPASVIWAASSTPLEATEDAAVSRQLFLRFHPSILGAVAANVEKCLNALPGRALTSAGSSSNRVEAAARHTVVATYRNLCSFELTGPMATDTIKACLRPVKNTSQEKLNAWKNLTPPAAVPAGSVFALNVQDPRLQ